MNEQEFETLWLEVGKSTFKKLKEYELEKRIKNPRKLIPNGFVFTVLATIKQEMKKRFVA